MTDPPPHVFEQFTRPEVEYQDVNSTDLHLALAEEIFLHWPDSGVADPANVADEIMQAIGTLSYPRLRTLLYLYALDNYRAAVERGGDR
jgi:hypothetical protein